MKVGKQFQREFHKRLAFLVTEYGFQETVFVEESMSDRMLFLSQDIALMLELEVREYIIFAMVLCRQEGRLPEHPYRDKNGSMLAYYVTELVPDFLSSDPDLVRLTSKRSNRRKEWQQWTEKCLAEEGEYYETLFRRYGREIFARARERFGLPPAE